MKKTITIDEDVWEQLVKRKIEKKQKNISAVILELLKTNKG